MREKEIENKIKAYLKSKNIWYVKYFANAYTPVGIPDILCCYKGQFIAIEVKNEKGKTTLLQERTLQKIRECGGISIVARSVEEVRDVIETMW